MAGPRVFSVDLVVRGYELDQWGHVNNAVYCNWLEHARWQMGEQLPLFDTRRHGILPVVRHLSLDYRCETRMHDRLRVSLWPRRAGSTSFVVGGCIRICAVAGDDDPTGPRVGALALTATMVLACVRRPGGKVALPAEWRPFFPDQDPGDAVPEDA